jgi:RecA-family ATPase
MPDKSNVDYRLAQDYLSSPDFKKSFTPAIWKDGDAPRLQWLVDGCFIPGTVALLSSDGGLGKSLLMQQLCTAVAIGRDWLGLKTQRVKAYAMFCEDDQDELWRRQERINKHYGCSMGDLEDVTYFSRAGMYNILCEFEKWGAMPKPTPLMHGIQIAARTYGAQLIVLDTASDVFGGNEIAKDQVRAFITLLRRWAMQCNGCVILTAHVSNEGLASESGLSGSRAWSNSVRSRIWLRDDKKNQGDLLLKTMKSNYGPRDGKIPLRWKDGVIQRIETIQPRNYAEPTLDEGDPF